MSYKPEIVKRLMEEEKLGKLKSHGNNEKVESLEKLPEESFEGLTEETIGSVENGVFAVNLNISNYREEDANQQDSKGLLQNVFDAITEGISILDTELNIVKTNKFMKDMYSNSMPLIGKKCYQAYQQRESPCPWCPSLLAIESGEPQTETVPYPSEGMPEGWLNLSSFPLKDTKGNILGVIESVRDITEHKNVKEKLGESEERFRDISLSMVDWIWEVDKDGIYTFASGRIKEILGYEPSEILGKTPFDLMPENEAKRVGEIFKEFANEKKPIVNLKNWNLTKKGEKVYLLTNGKPILSENGELMGYRGVDKDITEQKKSEEEFQKLASIVEHSSELVNLAMLDGKMIFLNEAGGKMLGINPDEVHKHVILDVIPENLQSKVKTEVLPSIFKKGKWEGELQYKNIKTGKITDVQAQTFMIKDTLSNKPMYFANTSLDITSRKKAEEKLKQKLDELETFHEVAVDREIKMINLEKEVNDLCKKFGENSRYDTSGYD